MNNTVVCFTMGNPDLNVIETYIDKSNTQGSTLKESIP